MILMALDHARDFLSLGIYFHLPVNLHEMTVPLFFTRWITHFAAPVFMFCAGIGIYFAGQRRKISQLSWLCFTRGLWLILLELTLVRFFWYFNFNLHVYKLAVLWAIGCSMIAMCIFVYLPKWIIFFIAASMFFFHNITDHLLPSHFGKIDWLWHILHAPGALHIGNFSIHIIYPVIPWIGVMALGYIFAPITQIDQAKRKKIITLLTSVSDKEFISI